MRIFWNKNVKITSEKNPFASGGWGLTHVITPAYYCKFVEFISCANCILLPSKDNKIIAVNFLRLLLPQLSHLFFILNSIVFVDGGCKNIFAPGRSIS